MSKKAFVLFLVAMIVVAICTLILTLTGHDDMVRSAFGSVASAAEALGTIGLVIVFLVIFG